MIRFAIVCLVASACAHRERLQADPPQAAVARYLATLNADDPDRAYALLAKSARRSLSRSEFSALWRKHSGERAAQQKALTPLPPVATESTEISLSTGLEASLVRESGRWRLAELPAGTDGARDPQQLLHGWLEALERRDLTALGRLCTPELRAQLEAALGDRAAALRRFLEQGKDLPATAGRLRYHETLYLDLVKIGDRWRLGDLN